MTKPNHSEPLANDPELLAEITAAFQLLGPNSRTYKFYSAVARPHNFDAKKPTKQRENVSPQELALTMAKFYDEKLRSLAIPDDPKAVTVDLEQQFLQSLSPDEAMALKIAAGWEPNLTRRSFLGGAGMAVAAALTASGATWMATRTKEQPKATPSPGTAVDSGSTPSSVTPDPAAMIAVAGLILMAASIMKQRQKRKGNPTTGTAQTEQPQTIAEILVQTEQKINASLRAAEARRSGESPAR